MWLTGVIFCACVYRYLRGFPTTTQKNDLKTAKDQDDILVKLMLQEAVDKPNPELTIEFELDMPNNYGQPSIIQRAHGFNKASIITLVDKVNSKFLELAGRAPDQRLHRHSFGGNWVNEYLKPNPHPQLIHGRSFHLRSYNADGTIVNAVSRDSGT